MKELHGANQVTPSTTNTAALLPENWRAELYCDLASFPIAVSEKWERRIQALTQQQGGEQEAGDGVTEAMVQCGLDAALEATYARLPRYSVVRAILTAALRTKQPAGEDCENMIDPVQIEVSIPGQLGTTVRFVERSWLYPNN